MDDQLVEILHNNYKTYDYPTWTKIIESKIEEGKDEDSSLGV